MATPKVSKQRIEQEIDLSEIFDVDLSEARPIKEALAQAIVDYMVERTKDGEGIRFSSDGRGTPITLKKPYSKNYAESLEFKAAGKSRSDVNMTLTGDMLSSIDVLSVSGNKIKIGITDGTQVLKAFNHITGDTVPSRPFFGVSKSELKEIASPFKVDVEEIRRSRRPRTFEEDEGLSALDRLRRAAGVEDDQD
jgi:hypothetical protein